MFDTGEPNRTLKTLLGAMVLVLGVQTVRVLFGSIAWYLRDTVGMGTLDLIPIALAPFVLGCVFPALSRWLTVRGALWAGVWVLVLTRVFGQIADLPAVDFWTSAVGTTAFVGLLPLLLSLGRTALVGGLLLGLAVDSAIKGMGLSLDLAYQPGIAPLFGVVAVSLAVLYLTWACPVVDRQGAPMPGAALLVGIGPLLFVEFLVLQSQGWTSEVADLTGPQAQLRIALLNVLTLILLPRLERIRAVTLLSVLVVAATVAVAEGPSLAFNVLSLACVPAAGLIWAALVPDPEERGLGAGATSLISGTVLFVTLGLVYYVTIDIDLGLSQATVRLVAGGLLAMFGLASLATTSATSPGATNQTWAFAALAALLPLLGLLASGLGEPRSDSPEGIRVMTYNIHSAFDTGGRFDIEEIARVIEDSGATAVGLQEVPRGQLISGVTDVLTLLQERLGFEHAVFFGTTDPTWGNAILSRYPVVSVDTTYLPKVGTPMRRGYLGAALDLGETELLLISTHLQHVNDRSAHDDDPEADLYPVHHEQIGAILSAWGGTQPALLVGDFNARPDWRQTAEIVDGGWVDSWTEAGSGDGFTASSVDPQYRIDYVFHTPDLIAIDAGVILSEASDHFPVVVDIAPR